MAENTLGTAGYVILLIFFAGDLNIYISLSLWMCVSTEN